MSKELGRIGAELHRLRSAHIALADPADTLRRQAATARRVQLEAHVERGLAAIESLKEAVERLQARLVAMRPAEGEQDRLDYERRWLGEQVKQKLEQLDVLMDRAQRDAKLLGPKIEWARRVEAGMSESDADRLAELETEAAARAELARPCEAVALAVDENGKVMP